MLSQPVAHPFYRVLSHRQEDGLSNEFCGFLRYMKQTPNFALSFYSYIRHRVNTYKHKLILGYTESILRGNLKWLTKLTNI